MTQALSRLRTTEAACGTRADRDAYQIDFKVNIDFKEAKISTAVYICELGYMADTMVHSTTFGLVADHWKMFMGIVAEMA
jgi:hypothetical protein